jgi:hypothetical protein
MWESRLYAFSVWFRVERLREFHINRSRPLVALPDLELDLVASRGAGQPINVAGVDENVVLPSVHVDEAISAVLEPSSYFTFQYISPRLSCSLENA